MLKNHMLRGVFEEMKSKGFPDDVVTGIAAVSYTHLENEGIKMIKRKATF